MQSNMILLKNLLRASSGRNILKYEKDKKKRKKITGGYVCMTILYIMLAAYVVGASIGFGSLGMGKTIPGMCAVSIIGMEFLFTLFKTNGYLFAFKEYDMLMSLPFSVKTVVSSKFLYMYVKNLPWVATIALPTMVGYGIFVKPSVLVYPVWIILSALLPIIPMVIASALGSFVAAIGSRFKYKKVVQTIFMFIFVFFCFASRYIIQAFFENDQVTNTLTEFSGALDNINQYLLPAKWFADSINELNLLSMFLLIALTVLIYELFFLVISKYYRRINSRLLSSAEHKNYHMQTLKTKSPLKTIVFKEFRRFMGSSLYMVNMGFGMILVLILAVVLLFVDMNSVISAITQGAPIDKKVILPAVPLIVHLLVNMAVTTACSLSLEGNNFWIPKSLPITMKTLVQGKMLFNLYLTIPFTLIGNICVGIACGADPLEILLFVVCGIALCLYATTLGSRCDVKHYKLDWQNEVEVVKQGTSVALYLLPNMFISMGLTVGVIALGFIVSPVIINLAILVVALLLALLFYSSAIKLSKRL